MFAALRSLAEEKRQARVTHAYRVVKWFGLSIRTKSEVDRFLAWIKAEGLAPSTQSTIFSKIRSVQPGNEPLRVVQLKVPARSVQAEVLSREEIKKVPVDLRSNKERLWPCLVFLIEHSTKECRSE